MSRKKKSSKRVTMIFCVVLLILFSSIACGYTTYHYNEVKYWDKFVYPGVTIEGINVAGKTKEGAKTLIKEKYLGQIDKKKINIKAEEKTFTLEYSKISPKYNIEEAVEQAFKYGKDYNFFTKYTIIKSSKAMNFNLKFSYDQKPIKELIDTMDKEVMKDPIDASLGSSGKGFYVVPEQDGKKLSKENLEKEVFEKMNGKLENSIEFKAPVETISAQIKGSMIKDIDTLIGGYSTEFGGISSGQRANNIRIATRSINGKVVMPGNTFSFNDTVGERTSDKGYLAAPVIVGNKLEDGLGGGVCQVSSTLFNAAHNAGLSSVERSHHTMPVHYVPQGMDATVDFGNIDYKFKNIYEYPIYVESYTAGGMITFNIYSSSKVK